MNVKVSLEENLVFLEYEKLCVLGVLGKYSGGLNEVKNLYKKEDVEFAPVKEEVGRNFLAGFSFKPVVDITIVQCPNEASIVTYSLDKNGSGDFVKDLIARSDFDPFLPEQKFIEQLRMEIGLIEEITYKAYISMSKALGCDIENVFGTIRYCHFLKSYIGMSDLESMTRASKQFCLRELKL